MREKKNMYVNGEDRDFEAFVTKASQSPRPFLMEWTRLAERRRYNSFSMRKNISFLLQA